MKNSDKIGIICIQVVLCLIVLITSNLIIKSTFVAIMIAIFIDILIIKFGAKKIKEID